MLDDHDDPVTYRVPLKRMAAAALFAAASFRLPDEPAPRLIRKKSADPKKRAARKAQRTARRITIKNR